MENHREDQENPTGLMEQLAAFILSTSQKRRSAYIASWIWFLAISVMLTMLPTVKNGSGGWTTSLFYLLPRPFNSIIIGPISETLYLTGGMLFSKALYYSVISWLVIYKNKPLGRSTNIESIYKVCCLLSISNLTIIVPYIGIWLSWLCESSCIIYFLKRTHKIKVLRSAPAILIYHIAVPIVIGQFTSVYTDFNSYLGVALLITLPLFGVIFPEIN